jgi:cardiolipin synthase A/B
MNQILTRLREDPHAAPTVHTEQHELTLFRETRALFAKMLEDIEAARQRVWIETYIYRSDRWGREFADVLMAAARRGVDVRLMYDALGSKNSDAAFFRELAGAGVSTRAFRPVRTVLRSLNWYPRDHSRLVLIDSAAYLGAFAWGDEWLPRDLGGGDWHDVGVRLEGQCVDSFQPVYGRRWLEAAGEGRTKNEDHETAAECEDVQCVFDVPDPSTPIHERHRERIQRARSRVWIENSYFCPPRDLLHDLFRAASRGVDVRIIVPRLNDLPSIQWAGRYCYAAWLKQGLKIYEYLPRVTHAKFAIVDHDWATLGSYNMNAASLRWPHEANVFVRDERFVAQMAELFEDDLRQSEAVTTAFMASRPLLERIGGMVACAAFHLTDRTRG